MARASTQLVIILLLLNASAVIVAQSGIGAALDIDPQPGNEEQIEAANETARNDLSTSQGTLDTLFGMFTSTASTLETIYNTIFYGPAMLKNLGVPWWITDTFSAGLAIIVAVDIVHALTGRVL